jgi:hypothetical protein
MIGGNMAAWLSVSASVDSRQSRRLVRRHQRLEDKNPPQARAAAL